MFRKWRISRSGRGDFVARRFLNFAVPDTGGTDADTFTSAVHESMDGLEVEIPTTLAHIVGVADAMPELRSATADVTNFSHRNTPMPGECRAQGKNQYT